MVEAKGIHTTPPEPPGGPVPVDGGPEAGRGPLPSLPGRLVAVLFSPVDLFRRLAAEPRWAAALLLGAVLSMASVAVVPAEMWADMMRQSMLEAGQPVPEGFDPDAFGSVQKVIAVVAGGVFWFLMAFAVAGVTALVFAFLLGDDGGYKQHLAVVAHALLVMAVGAVLITPLRLMEGDVQLTLNLGLFVPVEEGFAARYLRQLDLFWLWSFVLIGLGVHALDRRRGAVSAVAVVMVIPLAFAFLQAWLTGG